MSKIDPYNDFKKTHKAHLMNPRGGISPLCAKMPRSLNLKKDGWCTSDADVTCAKCLEAMGVPDAKAEAKRRTKKRMEACFDDGSAPPRAKGGAR